MTHITKRFGLTWCGARVESGALRFLDAQHFLLTVENGSGWGLPACEDCVAAILGLFETISEEDSDV